jgi:hypothetical protein
VLLGGLLILVSYIVFLGTTLQKKVQNLLKEGWLELPEDEKNTFRAWTEWDKKRYSRDVTIFESRRVDIEDAPANAEDDMKAVHVPKKRKSQADEDSAVPKKKKW